MRIEISSIKILPQSEGRPFACVFWTCGQTMNATNLIYSEKHALYSKYTIEDFLTAVKEILGEQKVAELEKRSYFIMQFRYILNPYLYRVFGFTI